VISIAGLNVTSETTGRRHQEGLEEVAQHRWVACVGHLTALRRRSGSLRHRVDRGRQPESPVHGGGVPLGQRWFG
jgi:hypothetical protein